MAPVKVDEARVHEFADMQSFQAWLSANHATEPELWIKIHKKGSGLATITPKEAIDVCLCWGWIDAISKSLDQTSYLQRYTPRGRKSVWSRINVENVARLIAEGRMTDHGLRHVESAKADGRWDKAYRVSGAEVPPELQAAINAVPEARATFEKLSSQNRFALIHRYSNLKTEAGRQKRMQATVEMLKRGESIYPQKL